MYPRLTYREASEWAVSIVARMTLEEKCAYVGGTDIFYTKSIERLGIPRVLFSDATAGVVLRDRFHEITYRNAIDRSTAFPAPILLASTWNVDLAEAYAGAIAEQCLANGIGVLLGPGFNLYRISQCGRNFEYFGEDPYLISRMIERYVQGVQNHGVVATLKHFVANNTDYFRRKSNSVVDERTLHEIYLPAFKAGIDAGAMAVMTSYNLVNGEWTGQSETIIRSLLRENLGFKWLVMSDWWSIYDCTKTVRSGQDLEMPATLATSELADLVASGELAEADLDRMVASILTTFKAMALFDRKPQPELVTRFPQHEQVALQTAREGTVLLRNQGQILPLNADESSGILLLGDYIHKKAYGGGSAYVKGYHQLSQYEVFRQTFGDRASYDPSPTDDTIANASHIILSIGTEDAESWDRSYSLSEGEERYVQRIVGLNPRVIVLVNAGSGIRMTDWYEQAAAIVFCWYNGQNGHIAVAEILTGQVNPSGKLPITLEREFSDGPGAEYVPSGETLYYGANDEWEKLKPVYDVHYREGVFVGYRWYEQKQIKPLYAFGFGLSYTHFEYGTLIVRQSRVQAGEPVELSFTLRNDGPREGRETVQVYIHDCDAAEPRPPQELKAFRKLSLEAGEQTVVEFSLPPSAFAYWSSQEKDWVIEAGEFEIRVGAASDDIRLIEKIIIE